MKLVPAAGMAVALAEVQPALLREVSLSAKLFRGTFSAKNVTNQMHGLVATSGCLGEDGRAFN